MSTLRLPRIPFSFAKANQILLIKGDDSEGSVPSLIHSPATDLSVLQEICRLVGPIRRIEQSSEKVLEALLPLFPEAPVFIHKGIWTLLK